MNNSTDSAQINNIKKNAPIILYLCNNDKKA